MKILSSLKHIVDIFSDIYSIIRKFNVKFIMMIYVGYNRLLICRLIKVLHTGLKLHRCLIHYNGLTF